MHKEKIAFLYNVRHQYPNPEDWETMRETDFDDPETIEAIRNWLEKEYEVLAIEANEEAYLKLYEYRDEIEMVFNYAEGKHGRDREAHLPAMLEMLKIPYTGSRPLTQALVLNKVKAKEVLRANNVSVLPGWVLETGDEELAQIKYPVIVKPVSQGSSAGITNDSVVFNEEDLRKQAKKVIGMFGDVLVELFLTGREFSVGMVGNPPMLLPVIEPDHKSLPEGYHPMDSNEVKWILEEEVGEDYLKCPAELDEDLLNRITEVCLKTWNALGVQDACRIDMRCDEEGNLYVLEVNSPAGIIPPEVSMTSYLPLAARRAGLSYGDLLKWIIDSAKERLKKERGEN